MSGVTVALPVASGRETWAAVWRLARPHRRLVAGGTLFLLGATLAALALPLLLGDIVDVVVAQRPAGDLDALVVALVVATVAQGVLFGLGGWAVGRLGELLLADLREEVVDRALAVPLEDVERAGSGDLVARACGDVDAVAEAMRDAIPEIVASSLIIGLTVVGLATLDWRLALAGLAALPVQAGAARWYLRRSRPLYAAERAAEGTRSQQLHASVTGARTIRALRLQDAHMATITGTSQGAVGLALAAASVRARFFSALNAAELVGLGTVLAVSYPLVQSDTITVGGATAAALYFYRLFDPVGALLTQLDAAQSAGAALARLVGVASLPAAGADPLQAGAGAARAPGRSDGRGGSPDRRAAATRSDPSRPGDAAPVPPVGAVGVRLRGVSFSYDGGRPALEGVDLVVRPGERVALVGPSGAGKSTVAKLVAGIHRASTGVVEVGGHDLAAPEVASTAASARPGGAGVVGSVGAGPVSAGTGPRVTLVTQEVHVFAGPLAADLRLARPGAGDGELRAALDRVGATPWVEALDGGLDTVVGEGGHRLSPTQAQQLALARLLLADPAVAILDEATAEAGSAGAGVLDDAAAAVVAGRTALVIAHRLTQAAAADRIVVLDRGKVVEQGTHPELLAASGLYADLWSAWSGTRVPH